MPIIETHTHLSHFKFENQFRFLDYDRSSCTFNIEQGDRDSVIKAMKQQGIVAAIEPGIDLASNKCLLNLAKQHPGWLFPAVGLHPTRTPNEKWKDRVILKELLTRPEVIAIGETGLDFHFQRKDQHRLTQGHWFFVGSEGYRHLGRCPKCRGYILVQRSECHGAIDDYYGDFFQVSGPAEAEAINAKYDGDTIEKAFPTRYLTETNGPPCVLALLLPAIPFSQNDR